jgi:predicted DNA binding CopG/RHH family protein
LAPNRRCGTTHARRRNVSLIQEPFSGLSDWTNTLFVIGPSRPYYERGILRSTLPSKSELKTLREAARATAMKDRRVNIRLSSPDLRDLRARALEEGLPYQTLIASVLHKFVAGRLVERPARSTRTARKRAAG